MPCAPGMTRCKAACLHRQSVQDYHRERRRQQLAAEAVTNGWPTELAEWYEQHPLLTFKAWLIATAVPGEIRGAA